MTKCSALKHVVGILNNSELFSLIVVNVFSWKYDIQDVCWFLSEQSIRHGRS